MIMQALLAFALMLTSCASPIPQTAQPWSVHPLPAATPAPCVEGVYSDVLRVCP